MDEQVIGTTTWMLVALRELGQREVPGVGDNPRIVDYHATTTLAAEHDAVPWCSAFVNWTLRRSGFVGTNSAAARSWAQYGAHASARYGAVVVLSRGANPSLGHVGFLVDGDRDLVWLLGGNQGDAVTVAPFARSRVVAMRWPVLEV